MKAFIVFASLLALASSAAIVKHRQAEPIDADGKYLLGWTVADGKITFDIAVESVGYIGLGLSADGTMAQADIFIGGVFANETSYAGDYHARQNGAPVLDAEQNWELESFSADETHTFLVVSRLIESTDTTTDDRNIVDGENFVIYAYGLTDDLTYHDRSRRGSKLLDLLANSA